MGAHLPAGKVRSLSVDHLCTRFPFCAILRGIDLQKFHTVLSHPLLVTSTEMIRHPAGCYCSSQFSRVRRRD